MECVSLPAQSTEMVEGMWLGVTVASQRNGGRVLVRSDASLVSFFIINSLFAKARPSLKIDKHICMDPSSGLSERVRCTQAVVLQCSSNTAFTLLPVILK